MIYLRLPDDAGRFPLDQKVKLVVDGAAQAEYGLVGLTFDLYDMLWEVIPGAIGSEGETEARVLRFYDQFAGIGVEIPLPIENADRLGRALMGHDPDAKSLFRRFRRRK